MNTVTITIKRGVLDQDEWNDFFRLTRDSVEALSDELIAVAPFKDGDNEHAIFHGNGVDVNNLRRHLLVIATRFNSDIGLSEGYTETVESLF